VDKRDARCGYVCKIVNIPILKRVTMPQRFQTMFRFLTYLMMLAGAEVTTHRGRKWALHPQQKNAQAWF